MSTAPSPFIIEDSSYREDVDLLIEKHGDVLREMASEVPDGETMESLSADPVKVNKEFKRRANDVGGAYIGTVMFAIDRIISERNS